MNKITQFIPSKWLFGIGGLLTVLLSGCSADNDSFVQESKEAILVPIEIKNTTYTGTRSIETEPSVINRILIIPYKKIDEGITANDDSNFAPAYEAAKQVDINATVSYVTKLNLTTGATYKVMVIGYNRNDYNFTDLNNPGNRFSIGSTGAPETLSNTYLLTQSAISVPNLFSAGCQSYNGANATGTYFKPEQVTLLKADLTRFVSGLNVEINNIPSNITSITLVAEKLVKGVILKDYSATSVINTGDADILKTFSTQTPQAGSVTFNHYLLPTLDANPTKLYLDVAYSTYVDRYEIKVPNVTGVSQNNSLSFSPNQVIKISGSFSLIQIGFDINYTINLEDDTWDGIQ